MNAIKKNCIDWYEKSYSKNGLSAQRFYPNEELCRFLGREYFSKTDKAERKKIRILETGCGSGANLWMIAKENFDAYGIDISEHGIALARRMLDYWGTKATLSIGDMTDLRYEANFFDAVVDIFSSYCLIEKKFDIYLNEVKKTLKPNGLFFSYTPSSNSDAFLNYAPSEKIDEWTLNGIKRETSPYFGNDYSFRFISPDHYRKLLEDKGFKINYLEVTGRTYQNMKEYFEFISIVAQKND